MANYLDQLDHKTEKKWPDFLMCWRSPFLASVKRWGEGGYTDMLHHLTLCFGFFKENKIFLEWGGGGGGGRNCSCSLQLHSLLLSLYLFGVLRRFQHCTDYITTGSWKGRGSHYIQLVKVLYYKLPTSGKQLPAFPLEVGPGTEPPPRGGRREYYHSATVAPCFPFNEN